jgi:hypothetical protein
MAAPIPNNPKALQTVLKMIAVNPVVKKKGITGMIAPVRNKKNEE